MKRSGMRFFRVILPIILFFSFSCASTPPKQNESRDAKFYNNRGAAYGEKGQYDQAISDFNRAIEINQRYTMAYNNRGIVYRLKGRYDQAISDFNKAIGINPLDPSSSLLALLASRGVAAAMLIRIGSMPSSPSRVASASGIRRRSE